MYSQEKWLMVCPAKQLAEKDYIIVDILYAGDPHSGIVFRFNGKLFAYLNRCVHMPRRLNCERDTIFDQDRKLLRCSMHGIVYAPETGRSLSTMCQGEKLQPLRLKEIEGVIYLTDKRVSPTMS